jgi:type IV pilus assembly protein PilC
MREIIAKMAEGIETGSPLSQVCSMHPKVFNNFFVSIVKSGEAAGKVSSSLSYLADHLEKDYNFNRKVLGALIYPIFVIVVLIGAFFLVTFFIIPKISEILQSFSGKLPFTTTVIIGLSHFVQKGGWAIIVFGFVALLILYFFFRKNPKTKMFYDKILLRVPIFGSFVMKINLVRLAENLSVLISSGLPITQALAITEDIMTNAVYKDIIKKAQEKVSQGEKISSLTQEYPQFISSFVTQMIATGEETGRLEETLKTVVDFYREETERTAANLTTLIEPVLILIMGIGIGFLAVGIFIPLFQIGLQGMGGM